MAHRYDRTGDRIDDGDGHPQEAHDPDPRCLNGWLGEDLDGRMVPCLICKPHLIEYFRARWSR